MRLRDLYLAGLGTRIVDLEPVQRAIDAGRYDAEQAIANDYESIAVSRDESAPEMAAAAGRQAVRASHVAPSDIAAVLHVSSWYQGIDFFPAASYVHRHVLGHEAHQAIALDVQQMSNGVAGLEVAAAYLAADPEHQAVLVTLADRFALPGFDRWRSDTRTIVFGDGASAAVLRRGTGIARLVAVATITDTRLEEMYRAPFNDVPGSQRPVDVHARRTAYRAVHDPAAVAGWTTDGLRAAVDRIVSESGVPLSDVTRFAFPHTGLAVLRSRYLDPLGVPVEATTWQWGRRTGHVGTTDQVSGLANLIDAGAVGSGDTVLLVGIGAGFAWSCALVEIV